MRLRKERVRATWMRGSASGPGRSLLSMLRRMMVWLRLLPSLNAVAETCICNPYSSVSADYSS